MLNLYKISFALSAVVFLNIGCTSNENEVLPNNEPANIFSNIDGNSDVLLDTNMILIEATDQDGSVFQMLDENTNYFVRFRADGIYEHNIFCQKRQGTFEINDSVLSISTAQISEVSDCPFGPEEDGELIAFILNFYQERQLIIDRSENELTFRGMENDLLRYAIEI